MTLSPAGVARAVAAFRQHLVRDLQQSEHSDQSEPTDHIAQGRKGE